MKSILILLNINQSSKILSYHELTIIDLGRIVSIVTDCRICICPDWEHGTGGLLGASASDSSLGKLFVFVSARPAQELNYWGRRLNLGSVSAKLHL